MGLIKRIRELFSSKRYILQAMEEQDRRLEIYRGLSTEGLSSLSDQELLEAALSRCDDRICQALGTLSEVEHPDDALALQKAPRTVYILSLMQDILATDGLFGFLAGEGRAFASMVTDCLLEVGANEHCALYTAFLQDNGLELSSLPTFSAAEATERDPIYPFADFDRAFESLPSLETYLPPYIRLHLQDF